MLYLVLNADGLQVAEYDNAAHAIESAQENAAAGLASTLDFYTACDETGTELGSWQPVDDVSTAIRRMESAA